MYLFSLDLVVRKIVYVVSPNMRVQFKRSFSPVLPFFTVFDVKDFSGSINLELCKVEGSTFDLTVVKDSHSLKNVLSDLKARIDRLQSFLSTGF